MQLYLSLQVIAQSPQVAVVPNVGGAVGNNDLGQIELVNSPLFGV